jgi:hypothetical protein
MSSAFISKPFQSLLPSLETEDLLAFACPIAAACTMLNDFGLRDSVSAGTVACDMLKSASAKMYMVLTWYGPERYPSSLASTAAARITN